VEKLVRLSKKKTLTAISLLFFLFLILALAYTFLSPLGWEKDEKSFFLLVEKGDSLHKISQKLEGSGLKFNPQLFSLSAKLLNVDRKIFPGRYDFQKGLTLWDLISKFYRKEISTIDVTIPEGSNLSQIAGILKKEIELDSTLFVKACFNTGLIHDLGLNSRNLEGYLFPDTYKLFWKMEPEKIIRIMVRELENVITDSLKSQLKKINLNLYEVLILASLIESEAKIDQERPLISSVYHNRLKIGMPLQCDPTVIYALGGLDRPLTLKDLEVDSPYNTYRYPGLPPGPINNPGKASILAAFSPAEVKYLYFVAKGDGSHIFSLDLEEHNRAKAKIKKENKS
jgi:UPF0755 protein